MDAINHLEAGGTTSSPAQASMLPGQIPCTPRSACSLPVELLWRIFLILRASTGDPMIRRRYNDRSKTHSSWLFVVHVWRSWRAAGIGCVDLWTTLPVGSPAFTSAILPWTKNAPLSIEVDDSKGTCATTMLLDMTSHFKSAGLTGGSSTMDQLSNLFSGFKERTRASGDKLRPVLQVLLTDPARLRSVDIEFGPREAPGLKQLLSTWTGKAPILEALSIKCNPISSGAGLPVEFLAGGAPGLRSLQLESTGALWKTIPFSANLTRVYLFEDDQFPTGAPRPTLEEFTDFLKSSVALEDLTLMEYLPRVGSEHYRLGYFKGARHTLPSLRKLVLHDENREIHHFALSVHMPKVTSIHFMFHCGAYPSETENILNDLRTAWSDEETGRNFAEGGVKHLEASDHRGLGAFSGHSIEMQFQPPFVQNPEPSHSLRLSFNNESGDDFFSFFEYLPPKVESLRSLKFSEVYKVPASDWRIAFATCPELHTITFSDSRSLSSFITALQVDFNDTKKSDNPNSGPFGTWLPGLKTIRFHDEADPRESYDREPLDQKLARRLVQTLRKRIQIASPIPEVVFQGRYECDAKTHQLLLSVPELGVRLEGRWQTPEEF